MLKKILISVLLIAVSVNLTACPSNKTIKRAFQASEGIASTCETAAETIDTFYTSGTITYEQKEMLIAGLKKVRDGGKSFHRLVDAVWQTYGTNVPADQWERLDRIFDEQILAVFEEILVNARLISGETGQKILTAIAVLRLTLRTVAKLFAEVGVKGKTAAFYQREIYANAG